MSLSSLNSHSPGRRCFLNLPQAMHEIQMSCPLHVIASTLKHWSGMSKDCNKCLIFIDYQDCSGLKVLTCQKCIMDKFFSY